MSIYTYIYTCKHLYKEPVSVSAGKLLYPPALPTVGLMDDRVPVFPGDPFVYHRLYVYGIKGIRTRCT